MVTVEYKILSSVDKNLSILKNMTKTIERSQITSSYYLHFTGGKLSSK